MTLEKPGAKLPQRWYGFVLYLLPEWPRFSVSDQLALTRFRPSVPILAFSPDDRAVRQLNLSWGTAPMLSPERPSGAEAVTDALNLARGQHGLQTGDQVVVISGISTESRQTDTLQLMRIP